MANLTEEETDISDSELEEYADLCYEKLNDGDLIVKVSDNAYICPYCSGFQKHNFRFEDLLQHASALSQGSKERKPRDRGRHLGLLKYVQNVIKAETSNSEALVVMEEGDESRDLNELYVWPWMGIVANIPVRFVNGISVGVSGSIIRDDLLMKGFNPVRVHPIWSSKGHSGYAVVEFRSEFLGFIDAIKFEKAYEALHQGKMDYVGLEEKGDKLYCWVAREDEFRMENAVGCHIRRNGNLRTIAQYQEEEKRKYDILVSHLGGTIEVKDEQIQEIKTKYKQTSITLSKLIDQKDEMIRDFNEEREKVQKIARDHLERISVDNERMRKDLERMRSALKKLEGELEKREAHNEMEKLMFKQQQNERAILEQKILDEKVLKLAEDHQREQEELNRKVIELEKQLDAKQAVVLEIQSLRGNVKVAMHMEDAGHENGAQYLSKLQEELKLKEEELQDLEALNQALLIKELKCIDELQDARMELVKAFDGLPSRAVIGVKRIGELNGKVFVAAAKRKHPNDADLMGARLHSLWESDLKDPNWNPFSKCSVEGNGDQYKTIVNEDDEKLISLRNEYGDEPYEAVKAALMEINQHKLQNPSGRYSTMVELWNNKDDRRATTTEGISYLIKQWRSLKKGRR